MNITRNIECSGEAIERRMGDMAPWLIGFAFLYFAGHVIVALLKGWI